MPDEPKIFSVKSRDDLSFTAVKKPILLGIAIIIVISLIFSTVFTVPAGERGVQLHFGAVTGVIYDEGLNFKIPFVQKVDKMDIKILKIETGTSAASKDLQIVTTTIALNYRLVPDRVAHIRQTIGMDYQPIIIDPAIQEAIKSATAKFTAEELITKRPIVREEMKIVLQEKLDILSVNSIIVAEFNIVDFSFSAEFDKAIEAKVKAEQDALKAERDLDRIIIEAQQKIVSAKAEAESIRIQSNALRNNPDILELRAIEKWDGVLPKVTGGVTPFIDITSLTQDENST